MMNSTDLIAFIFLHAGFSYSSSFSLASALSVSFEELGMKNSSKKLSGVGAKDRKGEIIQIPAAATILKTRITIVGFEIFR